MNNSNLNQLYSLRRDFTIMAVTGRTGSGCSKISHILSLPFEQFNLESDNCNKKTISSQKKQLVQNFCKKNWKQYKIIEYKKVLLFLLLPDLINNEKNTLLFDYYRFRLINESDKEINKLKTTIQNKIIEKKDLVLKIKKTKISYKSDKKLKEIGEIFWGAEFNGLAKEINDLLFDNGFIERKMLLHYIANNYRKSGQPY